MTANDRWVLFAVSMGLVILIALILWVNRNAEARRLRKKLNRVTAVELLCDGKYFDFYKMLRACRLPTRFRDIQFGEHFYCATINGKRKVRITLSRINSRLVLERIECLRGANWQFEDWYDDYTYQFDGDPLNYIVVGDSDFATAKKKRRTPGFVLTKRAVEQITDSCAFG